MLVRILSKPLPTLANPTSHHESNQGVTIYNQGILSSSARAQGRGHGNEGNPILQKKVIGASRKNASTREEGDRYDDNLDLSRYVNSVVPIHHPIRTRRDPRKVDYKKKSNDIQPLRYQDPRTLPRLFFSDNCFWLAHQAD